MNSVQTFTKVLNLKVHGVCLDIPVASYVFVHCISHV
jgi:hypothetical protein